jgi:hypothetical protein
MKTQQIWPLPAGCSHFSSGLSCPVNVTGISAAPYTLWKPPVQLINSRVTAVTHSIMILSALGSLWMIGASHYLMPSLIWSKSEDPACFLQVVEIPSLSSHQQQDNCYEIKHVNVAWLFLRLLPCPVYLWTPLLFPVGCRSPSSASQPPLAFLPKDWANSCDTDNDSAQ